ncbi:unnamed protein product [Staurois parvus]|uniref:Uncharacterized protein n=1 Tax=Staurois parvus TaxID=386267 RepID=A0ABN9DJH5_9NEOB|nr:unnamed protein product [Staurois parvus]
MIRVGDQRRTDHLETWALRKGPGSVEGPMRWLWYLFHRLFFEFGQGHRGPMIPYCPGAP